MHNRPVITLLTDFGLVDEYVASMKGVLLSRVPEAAIVDISHDLPHGDFRQAALLLQRTFPYFPPGTVNLAVVDPGVGTAREILAVKARGQFFVAPDNGLLSPLLRPGKDVVVHHVTNSDLFLPKRSTTFHGRDIMAPVAAGLACGLDISETGEQVLPSRCVILDEPQCRVEASRISGEVIRGDRFGNLCTNIPRSAFIRIPDPGSVSIEIEGYRIEGISMAYGDQQAGTLVALFESHDLLEIGVTKGSAAQRTGGAAGTAVTVSWQP